MTAVKRCPRCGQVKPAGEFYRRQRTRLSSYCRSCQAGRRPGDPPPAPPGRGRRRPAPSG
jgi:hypothetical protein